MPGLINWSTDPSSNDVSDPPVLWQEGQPANTVNNSARAMMASLACWRDDNAGTLVATRGANDAYAVATAQVFTAAAAAKSHTLAFTVSADNQGPASLSPDSNSAKPILRRLGRQLGPGDLTTGVLYRAHYLPSASAYVIVSPVIERPGRISVQADAVTDPGWVPCDGRLLSRTSYAALFAAIGATYGAGDGTTTFAVPDFRGGRAPMGPGLTGAGGIGGTIGSSGGVEVISLSVAQLPAHNHTGSTAAGGGVAAGTTGGGGAHDHGGATAGGGGHNHTGTTGNSGGHSHTGSTDGGGSHAHGISHTIQVGYQGGGGGQAVAVQSIKPSGTPNTLGQTEADGTHSHGFTTNGVGDHAHGFTTGTVGDHAHAISAAASHTHATPAVSDHTHALTIDNAGSGAAHPNMPPGLVVAFAIKA